MANSLIRQDKLRYGGHKLPRVQRYYRMASSARIKPVKALYRLLFAMAKRKCFLEISPSCSIGGGLYMGHVYCITINPRATLGRNVNIHKGVTIGQENRGPRQGVPTIGDRVWIGVNATIVGKITIGEDVLIAPNTYVNRDIPAHSVVFGNPCIIKPRENATEGYINYIAE